MNTPATCPECLRFGTVRLVSRSQLEALASDAGLRLARRRRVEALRYWWCDRCLNGGAIVRWSTVNRSA
jgi:hypothetical protein